jgi:hypothetical protein
LNFVIVTRPTSQTHSFVAFDNESVMKGLKILNGLVIFLRRK